MIDMKVTVSFLNWSNALAEAPLSAKERNRHRIIIQWFLGYLKRKDCPASVYSARQFMAELIETRRPEDWSRKRLRLTRLCPTRFRKRAQDHGN